MSVSAPVSPAANHIVHMTGGWEFSPASLTVEWGDTVTWINDDDVFAHDATSVTELWTTGAVDFEASATLTFNTPGTFPYRDSLFFFLGMTGTITVNDPPPSPRMIAPRLLPGGAFCFTLTNLSVGKPSVIETSTNLATWIPLTTNVPVDVSMEFTNTASAPRFYRFWQAP